MGKKTYTEDDLVRVAGVVAEKIEDRIDLLQENIALMIERHTRLIIREELVEVKQDVKLIKTAVKDTNRDLHRLERRVTKLQTT